MGIPLNLIKVPPTFLEEIPNVKYKTNKQVCLILTTETIALPIFLILPIDLESMSEPKNNKLK